VVILAWRDVTSTNLCYNLQCKMLSKSVQRFSSFDITKILFFDHFEIRKIYGVSKRGTKCSPLPPNFWLKGFLLRQKVFTRAGHELRTNCTQKRMWVFVKRIYFLSFFLKSHVNFHRKSLIPNSEFSSAVMALVVGHWRTDTPSTEGPFLLGKEGLQGIFLSR
jgi:hypothetical protein